MSYVALFRLLAVFVASMAFGSVASAQAISGVVTDASGAVLPGVTVEARSPALIEGVRSAVSDDTGRYSILALRPGTYDVSFTLSGFSTVKREGILLTLDFTAPVNVQLAVGDISEVVQVTGAPPLVDAQNLSRPQVISSEMLETLPLNNRSLNDIANRVVGVAPGGFGSGLQYRGSGDVTVTVDGNRTSYLNLFLGAGGTTGALSAEAYQEYSFTSGIDNVDSGQGGIRINVVPKDGGNRFSGSIFALYTGDGWRSDNISDTYAAPPFNFRAPAATRRQYDFNPSFGGPIIKDKLWYQHTGRVAKTDTYILGAFRDVNPDPLIVQSDPNQQYSSEGPELYSGGTRITWQMTARDKISGFYDDQWSRTPHSAGFGVSAGENPDGMGIGFTPHTRNLGIKWTRTHSAHLVLEGGGSIFRTDTFFEPQPGVGESWAPRHGGVAPGKFIGQGLDVPVSLNDIALRVITAGQFLRIGPQSGNLSPFIGGNSAISSGISKTWTANLSGTFILGQHTVRAGMTFFRGSQLAQERLVGDLALNYERVGGVLTPSNIYAYIPQDSVANVDADWGLYVQDQWTLRRFTIKPSLRLDVLQTSVPDQRMPPSIWIPTEQNCGNNRFYCARDGVSFKDLSPRLSVTYDMFGNGKTVAKGGVARYVDGDRLGLTNAINPTGLGSIIRSATLVWTDLDGDLTVINPNGSYDLNELSAPTTAFGSPNPTTTYAPEIFSGWFARGYTWEGQVGVDHQLLPRVAVTAMYYHRTAGNQLATDNLATGPDAYNEYCIVTPNDPRLGEMAAQTVCGLFDISPAGLAAQNAAQAALLASGTPPNFRTYAKNLGTGAGFRNISDGVEITVRTNLPGGAFIQGGFDIRSALTDTCGFFESPEIRFCRTRRAFNYLPKFIGAYTLPWGIQASATYLMVRGPSLRPNWTINSTTRGGIEIDDVAVAAASGVPKTLPPTHIPAGLTEVALVGSGVTRSRVVQLFEPNQDFLPYVHTLDVRFAKIVSLSRYRFTVGVDLYNAINASSVTTIASTSIGTTANPEAARVNFQRPSAIQAPRQFKISSTFSF